MKAVALTQYLANNDLQSFFDDIELATPMPGKNDLLVRVQAVSVNPVDTKVRATKSQLQPGSNHVLGWDAAGIVESVGSDVTQFKLGDEVYYAGDLTRPGSNSEFQLVDERLVGCKPRTLSFAEAAALPLTVLTAWEGFFERLNIDPDESNTGNSILIIGGAGGVGSIGIQLAKHVGLCVIATASNPESQAWAKTMGADHVVDYRLPLPEQLTSLGFKEVDFIANFVNTDSYWNVMAQLIRPQGKIVLIVENKAPLDLNLLKSKSAAVAWEFMFTRSMYQTPDMAVQGEILNKVAVLIDNGKLRTTVNELLSPINAENMWRAHQQIESGQTIGKLVLAGWH